MAMYDDPRAPILHGYAYVYGNTSGRLIASSMELSFWGGVSSETGAIIDHHHPLSGTSLKDAIVAIPGGRGSCSGSCVLLELILNKKGPKALLFQRRDDILTLGAIVADEVFGRAIPIVCLGEQNFELVMRWDGSHVLVNGHEITVAESGPGSSQKMADGMEQRNCLLPNEMKLSNFDKALLDGLHGVAARASIRIVLRMAELLGCQELTDVEKAHIDACIYTGPGSLAFAQTLRDWGGSVRVPTTMNSISVDHARWRIQGIDLQFGEAAAKLADAYVEMGAKPTFTCAPYQLDNAPTFGEQVAWAESNAVVYANSVLGARTMKYPDFLDVAIALTGRAPAGGPHMNMHRKASLIIRAKCVQQLEGIDDSFYPVLGYHIGCLASSRIPVVDGIQHLHPTKDDLKAFGAAFATVSSAPMFHIVGITPEATNIQEVVVQTSALQAVDLQLSSLLTCWDQLNSTSRRKPVDLVSLGNPHFSLSEMRKLAVLCRGRTKDSGIAVVVTCGRATYSLAEQAGVIGDLERVGVALMTDTCWCMIADPIIPRSTKAIVTNSGKYAHYGPGLTGKSFYFRSLSACVEAACGGSLGGKPQWLSCIV